MVSALQIELFNCDISHQREERGQAPVTSVWLWGGAAGLPVPAGFGAGIDAVWGDHPLLEAVAAQGAVECLSTLRGAGGGVLAVARNDGQGLDVVDDSLDALSQGTLDGVRFIDPDTGSLVVAKPNWWQRLIARKSD